MRFFRRGESAATLVKPRKVKRAAESARPFFRPEDDALRSATIYSAIYHLEIKWPDFFKAISITLSPNLASKSYNFCSVLKTVLYLVNYAELNNVAYFG